jgi:hypothetical protein
MNYATRTLASVAVLSLLLLVPVTFQPQSLIADGPGSLVRLNDACGQATSCRMLSGYICSTHNEDHKGYTCNTGCENVEHPT